MKNRVDLPGLAILVALVLGSALEGVLGALVSVPTAVLVAVLLDEYFVHKDARDRSLHLRPGSSLGPPELKEVAVSPVHSFR